jgi:hypothetical protein
MKFSRSDFEMQRFESRRPNQPVRLKRVKYEGRSKTAPYRRFSLSVKPLDRCSAKLPRTSTIIDLNGGGHAGREAEENNVLLSKCESLCLAAITVRVGGDVRGLTVLAAFSRPKKS